MKGVILAGGLGTRLGLLTRITNKHLLNVWDRPMIFYPLQTLIDAGIKEILIVAGPEHAGDFLRLLGSGKEFAAKLTYELQDEAGGIAQALSLAEDFADNGKIAVILGDNIFENSIKAHVEGFEEGAKIFLKEVPDPQRFGVPILEGEKVSAIEEKPEKPKSNYAVTGLYLYDKKVFSIIKTLKPSDRGELEITDVNNAYIKQGKMQHSILEGFWTDAGTPEALLLAAKLVKKKNEDRS